jgi:alkylated DNA repair dioxygenase AlkB
MYPPQKEIPINIPQHPIIYDKALNAYVTDTSHLPVSGLVYIPNFITDEEHDILWNIIYSNPFTQLIHRRQQFYGETYYHTTHDVKALQPVGESINHLDIKQFSFVIEKLKKNGYFVDCDPDQVLVNEYVGKCGIAKHFDDSNAFGDTICTISLGRGIWVQLCTESGDSFKVYVDKNSLFCYRDDARYKFMHGISKTATWVRIPGGEVVKRSNEFVRVSLTIRHLLDGRKRVEKDTTGWQ